MGKISRAESDMDDGLSLESSKVINGTTNHPKTVLLSMDSDASLYGVYSHSFFKNQNQRR